jgi:hypothetical protein
MEKNNLSTVLPIIGVVIGALLTFSAQFVLSSKQQESEIRKKAIDLKNEQCVALWGDFAATYQYLFFSGNYSQDKIDIKGLGQHIKNLNVSIIRVEPFITHNGFLDLMNVRDTLNRYYLEWEEHEKKDQLERQGGGPFRMAPFPSYNEYIDFINKLEEPMHKARDVLRSELRLVNLRVVPNEL